MKDTEFPVDPEFVGHMHRLKPELAAKAKEKQEAQGERGKEGGRGNKKTLCQISDKGFDTKKELATKTGVSHDTLAKAEFIAKRADDETKEKLRRGETTINKEHKALRKENDTYRNPFAVANAVRWFPSCPVEPAVPDARQQHLPSRRK